MGKSRWDRMQLRLIADETGIPPQEVSRAVDSFFSVILREASALPFNDERRIYTKDAFDENVSVHNIPFIGRIGPVYSRYLAWRANEARWLETAPRSSYRTGLTQSEIEHMAEEILSGHAIPEIGRKRRSDLFENVWIVGKKGKRLARQVILKKQDTNVQD